MITIKGEIFSSKNHMQILRNPKTGRPFIVKGSAALKAEKPIMAELKRNKAAWMKMIAGHPFPLFVVFKLYPRTGRRCDFTNMIQGLADLMVKCEYMPDDNMKVFLPIPAEPVVDPSNPRTEIWLLSHGQASNLKREQLSLL
jgi:hypothetical protein